MINSDLSVVYKTTLTVKAWQTMALVRGDGYYTIVIIPGVLIKPIGYSFTSDNTLIISIFSSIGWLNDYNLNATSIIQEEYGIRINSSGSYGEAGVCVFSSTATLY